MYRLFHKNLEYWTHERSLKALLIYLSVSLFVLLPLSHGKIWEQLVQDILFNLILLSGVFAVFSYKWQRTLFIGIALSAFLLRLMAYISIHPSIRMADQIVSLLYFISLSLFVIRIVFKDKPVNNYRVQGAVVFYLLFGIICAYMYNILYMLDPKSVVFQIEPQGTAFFSKFLYFSFVIQTTLGIGDIIPVHPLVKSLVIFQAMMGMLYPVIIVARLVSMEIEYSRDSRRAEKT